MIDTRIRKIIKIDRSDLYFLLGTFLFTIYHLHTKFNWPQQQFSRKKALISCFIFFIVVFFIGHLFKFIYHKLINYWKLSNFWKNDFSSRLDKLFVLVSIVPLVSFLNNDFFKLLVLSLIFFLIYLFTNHLFKGHQFSNKWQLVNKWVFF